MNKIFGRRVGINYSGPAQNTVTIQSMTERAAGNWLLIIISGLSGSLLVAITAEYFADDFISHFRPALMMMMIRVGPGQTNPVV